MRGVDPLAMRLELTKNHPRASAVIKAVAEMADWKRKRPGRALGLAFADYHDTLTAGIAEISVDRATGKIKVHNYWIVADPGLVVQPDNALAQIESAVIYGLSGALSEELTVKDGAVQQSNFGDYHVLRMSDVPPIQAGQIEAARQSRHDPRPQAARLRAEQAQDLFEVLDHCGVRAAALVAQKARRYPLIDHVALLKEQLPWSHGRADDRDDQQHRG